MATLEQWKNRKSTRSFNRNKIPDFNTILEIENCLNYLPIQVTDSNRNKPNHLVFRLDPSDILLKQRLVNNIFSTPRPTEYFTEIYDAPYVYLLCEALLDGRSVECDDFVIHRNVGFTAGVLISEAVSRNLDTGQIACVQDVSKKPIIKGKVEGMLNKRFKEELLQLRNAHGNNLGIGQINMAVCLGYKQKHEHNQYIKHPVLQRKTFTGSKLPNRNQPFMFVNNV